MLPQGLEIMGFGTLEPGKYMNDEKKTDVKTCPFRQRNCNKSKCALWNDEKKRCGLLR